MWPIDEIKLDAGFTSCNTLDAPSAAKERSQKGKIKTLNLITNADSLTSDHPTHKLHE